MVRHRNRPLPVLPSPLLPCPSQVRTRATWFRLGVVAQFPGAFLFGSPEKFFGLSRLTLEQDAEPADQTGIGVQLARRLACALCVALHSGHDSPQRRTSATLTDPGQNP